MEIKDVLAFPVRVKGAETTYADAFGRASYLDMILVIVESNEGFYGVGETWPGHSSIVGGTTGSYLDFILNHIKPLIIGEDPCNVNKIHSMIEEKILGVGYGNISNHMCIAGVDYALYDLAGKIMGKSVAELTGGKVREKLEYTPCSGVLPPDKLAEYYAKELKSGHFKNAKYAKVKVGGFPYYDLKKDVKCIEAVREVVGPDVTLIPDANQSWTVGDAISVIKKMEKYNPIMVEQPTPRRDIHGLVRVAKSVDVPIVADGSVYTPERVWQVAKTGVIDYYNLKPMRNGGIHGALKCIHLLEAAGMKVNLDGTMETMIGTTVLTHLASVISDRAHFYDGAAGMLPLLDEPMALLKGGGVVLKEDYYMAPTNPGIGIELKDEVLKRGREYRFPQFPPIYP